MSHIDKDQQVLFTLGDYEEYLKYKSALIHADHILKILKDEGKLDEWKILYGGFLQVFGETKLSKSITEWEAENAARRAREANAS